MKKNIVYLVGLLALIFSGCANQDSIAVEENMEKPFFDVKGFFESEIAESKLTKIEKTVRINGKSETQQSEHE